MDSEVKEWIENVKELFSKGIFDFKATAEIESLLPSFLETGSVMKLREIVKVLREQTRLRKIIFISYARKDNYFVNALCGLLTNLGISEIHFFKDDRVNEGIDLGCDIISNLKKQFEGNIDFVAIVSDNYLNSPYCMNEVGGAWIGGKRVFKIYKPFFRPEKEKGVLQGMGLGLDITEEKRLKEFIKYVCDRYLGRSPNIDKKINDFINKQTQIKNLYEKTRKDVNEFLETQILSSDLREKICKDVNEFLASQPLLTDLHEKICNNIDEFLKTKEEVKKENGKSKNKTDDTKKIR